MEIRAILPVLILVSVCFSGITAEESESFSLDKDQVTTKGMESFSFDFGARGSPVISFNTGVTNRTIYTHERGYGLLESTEGFYVTPRMLQDVSPHILSRRWVYDEYGTDLTVDGIRSRDMISFRVDLPNGTYRLKLILGDLEKGIYSMNVSVNDKWVLEGADAFHNVFRSTYYTYQPDPRNPEKEFINYGMAVPYYLKVDVTKGHMIINITGNDTAYRDLLREEMAKAPPISYLSWMSTGNIKRSNGEGPWRYIGGPFTNASLLGLSISPHPDFPIDGEIGTLEADRDIDSTEVLMGVESANFGNLVGAFLHWKKAMDQDLQGRNRLARSQLGMILAGSLDLEREIEILPRVETDIYTNTALRGDPAQVELWTWANIANRGLHFEFNRTMYPGDGEVKNHFFEANKAFSLLNTIPEISPLHPKIELWKARCLMNLDPHRWTSASGTALDMMENLLPLDPDNPYLRMYLNTTREDPPTWEIPTPVISTTGEYDNWTLNDYSSGYEDSPRWASIIHEELGWLYDVTDWWVEHRMQDNGYLGGGWTDDVEMIGLFGFDALISEGADELSLEGAGRFVDGMLSSGQVNMTLGYSEAFADVEHTAELTGDSLPMMVAVDYGNPKWIEFSMKTAALMRDLWMGYNEKGWYQFKSNYLSATRIGTGGRAEDSWINFRAALPAMWAWWYSNDPEIERLLVDWAGCWVNASISTEKGKPQGIIPAGIGWPDGEIGGHNSPNWYTADHPSGSVNYDWAPQNYKSYITTLLETAFEATRDPLYLEPLRLEAQIAQEYIDDPIDRPEKGSREWAGMILGQKAIERYRSTLDKYQLPGSGPSSTLWDSRKVVESCEDGYHYVRKCYPLMTTEASATDRVLFVGVPNPFLIFTGGHIGGALLAPQFTYSGLGRDFAAMVRDANAKTANISLYGFYEGAREASIMPWSLEIGGVYSIMAGPDENGNGIMEEMDHYSNFTYLTRGQKIPFNLTGDVEYLVKIEQLREGSGLRPRMGDPAFDEEDEVSVDKKNGTVTVKVHNIGSEKVEDLDIYLYEDLDGGLRHIGGARDVDVPAPEGLEPSIIDVDLHVWEKPWIGEVAIRIDPDDEINEISESNNEIWGYRDLEGINVTPPDKPIELNGSIPVVDVYEDVPQDRAIDLSQYIWDPDGVGLIFSIGPIHYSLPWVPIVKGSWVDFHPSRFKGQNYNGRIVFDECKARGPGKDGIWDTEEDNDLFRFNLTLNVIPVNDPPVLKGIRVNGTLISNTPGENLSFTIRERENWTGELIVSDVDNYLVNVTLGSDDDNITLEGNYLYVNTTGWLSQLKLLDILIDDGIGPAVVEQIEFRIVWSHQPPVWAGVRYQNGSTVFAYEDTVDVYVTQGEELVLDLLVEDVYHVSLWKVSGTEDLIINEDRIRLSARQEHVDLSPLEVVIRAINRWDLSSDLNIHIHVKDVNDIPTAPMIEVDFESAKVGSSINFSSSGSTDPDGDDLEYMWDLGDGNSTEWGSTLHLEHKYTAKGRYVVSLMVKDGRGGENSSSIYLDIEDSPQEEGEGEETDEEIEDNPEEWLLPAIALILLLLIILLGIMAFTTWRERRYEPEWEMGPSENSAGLYDAEVYENLSRVIEE